MAVERVVLVVSPTPSVAQAVAAAARRSGYLACVVKTFAEAKQRMQVAPHLLITELKLAEYNGLQLALRARLSDAPAIVIADESFEQEVEQHGATWVSPAMLRTGELDHLILGLTQGALAAEAAYGWYAETTTAGTHVTKWVPPSPSLLH